MADKSNAADKRATPASQPSGAGARRVVALNVVVASLLVAGLVFAANYIAWWLGARYDLKADLTRGQRHSFSSRTKVTLNQLTGDVHLTSLFVADEKDETARLEKQRVEDLLRGYERASGNVVATFIDPAEEPEKLYDLGQRIAALHADEVVPYVQGVKDALAFEQKLAVLLGSELTLFQDASRETVESPVVKNFLGQVVLGLGMQSASHKKLVDSLREEFASDLGLQRDEALKKASAGFGVPGYSDALGRVTAEVDATANLLAQIAQGADQILRAEGMKLPGPVEKALADAEDRYADVQRQMVTLVDAFPTEPLELEQTLQQISFSSVIVEAAGQVRVLDRDELWPVVPGQERFDPTAQRGFSGEEAVTSALTSLTAERKPAAIFVTWGGMPVNEYRGNFTEIVTRLRRSNFSISTWDLTSGAEMPVVDGMSRAVLVVMVPEPPQGRMPMPPPNAQAYEPVRKVLADGGSAMVFGAPRVGMNPPLPYAAVLEDFGINLRQEAATIRSQEMMGGDRGVATYFSTKRYPSESASGPVHPIVAPLQSMVSAFLAPVPLMKSNSLPEGVEVWPLVEIPDNRDYWGETDLMTLVSKQTAEFDAASDIASPYPVAVAVVRKTPASPPSEDAGTDAQAEMKESRVVAFGDTFFASDRLAQRNWTPTGRDTVAWDYPYPANGELVTNAMLWLAHEEDRIAVSPQAQQAARIGDIRPGTYRVIRWALWVGLPLVVVAAGIMVFVFRTRVR